MDAGNVNLLVDYADSQPMICGFVCHQAQQSAEGQMPAEGTPGRVWSCAGNSCVEHPTLVYGPTGPPGGVIPSTAANAEPAPTTPLQQGPPSSGMKPASAGRMESILQSHHVEGISERASGILSEWSKATNTKLLVRVDTVG